MNPMIIWMLIGWELEANVIITNECKVKMLYFNTPSVTAKYSKTSDLCWRNCGWWVTSLIFWDCPKIIDFCVKTEIKRILGIDLRLDSNLYKLGIIPEDWIDRDCSYFLKVLLLIAKKKVTINWLKPHPPT